MNNFSARRLLILEPNQNLVFPYAFLPPVANLSRLSGFENGLKEIALSQFDLVFLSASFSPAQSLRFLENLKLSSGALLIPLVIIVDLNHRLNTLLGTSWGGRIAVLDSQVSKPEFFLALDRVLCF